MTIPPATPNDLKLDLEERITTLEAALKKHGVHMGSCSFWESDDDEPCNCGFKELTEETPDD